MISSYIYTSRTVQSQAGNLVPQFPSPQCNNIPGIGLMPLGNLESLRQPESSGSQSCTMEKTDSLIENILLMPNVYLKISSRKRLLQILYTDHRCQ